MAAPYVSGAAGLLTSKGLTDSQVRYCPGSLLHRVEDDKSGEARQGWVFGYGCINAQAAVTYWRVYS